MQTIQANFTASISELKKSPAQILKQAGDNVVAILNHNIPSAYLVPSSVYEKMTEIIEEYHLSKAVDAALASGEKPVKVSLDELWVRILLSVKKDFIKNFKIFAIQSFNNRKINNKKKSKFIESIL